MAVIELGPGASGAIDDMEITLSAESVAIIGICVVILLAVVGGFVAQVRYTSKLATREELHGTRDELRQEITATRDELRQEMAAMREEFRRDMAAMRDELREEFHRGMAADARGVPPGHSGHAR